MFRFPATQLMKSLLQKKGASVWNLTKTSKSYNSLHNARGDYSNDLIFGKVPKVTPIGKTKVLKGVLYVSACITLGFYVAKVGSILVNLEEYLDDDDDDDDY